MPGLPESLRRLDSYRTSALLLGLAILGFFLPCIVRGEVLFPHSNSFEVGYASDVEGNRAYSDTSAFYVPELHHNVHGRTYWNPHSELGRPAFHMYGMSRVFYLTQALELITRDTLVLHFLSTALAIVGIAAFAFLFLRANRVRPTACLVGSLYLSIGPFAIACQNFPLFLWGVCWALAILFAMTRFVERPSPGWGFALVLFTHSMAMTAYPQHAVWHGYLIVGWLVWLLWNRCTPGRRARTFLGIAAAGLIGALSALPMYADLAVLSGASQRGDTGYDFIVRALPGMSSLDDFLRLFLVLSDPSVLGNILSPDYTTPYAGSSFTPLGAFLILGLFVNRKAREYWPIVIVLFASILLATVPGLYELAVRYLGLGLSRTNPIRMLHVPAGLLMAFSASHMLASGRSGVTLGLAAAWSAAFVLAVESEADPQTRNLVWTALGFTGAFLFLARPLPTTLLLAAAVTFGSPTACVQTRYAPADVHLTSPLIEHLREKTRGGRRFAVVQREYGQRTEVGTLRFLPSNQESLYGLASIHTYNPLASHEYMQWASEDLGAWVGRRFVGISRPDALVEPAFRLSGVDVLATRGVIHEDLARPAETFEQIQLYEPLAEPLLFGRSAEFTSDEEGLHVDPRRIHQKSVEELPSASHDERNFKLAVRRKETVLFCSTQFHPHWMATGEREDGERIVLETARLNGIYLGVRIPEGISAVQLRFEPHVRWMGASKGLLLALGLATAALSLLRRERGSPEPC